MVTCGEGSFMVLLTFVGDCTGCRLERFVPRDTGVTVGLLAIGVFCTMIFPGVVLGLFGVCFSLICPGMYFSRQIQQNSCLQA